MTNKIKLLVRFLFTVVLVSGFFLVKRAFGQDSYKEQLHQYKIVYAELLVKKIVKFHKNVPIVLFLKDGSEVVGIYKGYAKYDDTLWVKENGHWLSSGYSINELFDVSIKEKRAV